MATKNDYRHYTKKTATSFASSLLFLSLICIFTVFLGFALYRTSQSRTTDPETTPVKSTRGSNLIYSNLSCDLTNGRWIYNSRSRSLRYDNTCKEIYKGWNCIGSGKSNALDIVKWRWKPYDCELPQFDPLLFLKQFANTNIGFVGDSINRNMFVSLFCTLRRVSTEVKKWRPAGADRGFTFLDYNLTIAYHRTNLLARYGRWSADTNGGVLESLGYKEGYRIDVDIPDRSWIQAPKFHDILIFNTGHWWWAPVKFDPVKSPMLFFERGMPVTPPAAPDVGLDMVLKHMVQCPYIFDVKSPNHSFYFCKNSAGDRAEVSFIQETIRPGTITFFRSQSPRHFEGGEWDQGGSCKRIRPLEQQEVEEFFSVENNGTNAEVCLVNQHLYKALKGTDFHMLEITRLSEFRADAHPSTAGGKKHEDCMHWCLPGITDTWNDLFVAHLNRIKYWDAVQ